MGWAVPKAPLYLTFYLLAFLPYFGAICLVLAKSRSKGALVVILLFAVAFRLVGISKWPPMSTDVYRYHWDGKVQSHGIIPYLYAPNDERLRHLRDRLWKRINNKHVKTIYPPASELLFLACYKADPDDVLPFKFAFVFFDLLAIATVLGLLRKLGLPLERCLIYAWSPLTVDAFALNAHQDSLGIFAFLLALNFAVRGRAEFAGLALSLSAMSKGVPALLLPAIVRRAGWGAVGWFVFGVLFFLAPYVKGGTQLAGGLGPFTACWHHNSGLYDLLWLILRPLPKETVVARSLVASSVFCLAFFFAPRVSRDDRNLLRACFWILAVLILLSPAVFPWYLCWLVPFLCIRPRWGWLSLTALVSLCYALYPASPLSSAYIPLVLVEYLLPLSLLLWEERETVKRKLLEPIR